MNYGQPDSYVIDGITVLKCHALNEGMPVVRFIYPRLTSVWSAMKRTNADVYYQRGCGALTGIVAAFCRAYERTFIYAAAHNADFDPRLPLINYLRDRAIFRWGLRRSTAVLVQNQSQLADIQSHFKRRGVLLPSCYVPPTDAHNDPSGYVLWVSTMRRWKRPELFMDLAASLPHLIFRMVGGPDDKEYFAALQRRANGLPNLRFLGFVPYADIEREFNGARVFVNTSESEGFPNTLLQAWSRGIPTVSFFGVETVKDRGSPSQTIGSLEEMRGAVDLLMTDHAAWREAGQRCRLYFREHHASDPVVDQFLALLESLTVSKRSHAVEGTRS